MANLGSLVVSLEANIAKFTSDMGRAADQTQQAMNKMNGAINMVKGGIAALGVGLSVGAIAALVKETIDAADNLRDMSQKSGVAIETLNGLGFAAGQAGGSLETVVEAAGKLNKSIVEAAGGNKDTTEAFNKLGISVRDSAGALKTADVLMAEVADKFKNYADGPAKTAIALRLFSKAGADMIPLLNDGGDAMRENIEYAKKYSGVTTELANGSDNFNDAMGKLAIQQKNFANVMTTAALPVMQAIVDELLHSAEGSDKFAGSAGGLRKTLSELAIAGAEVVFTFKSVWSEFAVWHDQAAALGVSFTDMAKGPAGIATALAKAAASGNLSFSKFTGISDAYKKDAERARIEHDEFLERLRKSGEATAPEEAAGGDDKPKPQAPTLRAKGDDPTKALMEGRLKAIEAAYAAEQDTASFHDKFMQALRSQDIVDLQTYEAYKIAAIDNGSANAQRAYDAEIAVLQNAKKSIAKESDRAEIDNKIKELSAKKEKALRDAQQDRTLAILGQSAAQSGLNKELQDWSRAQTEATAQFQFEIDLYGKSTLEANKLTAARRIYLDVEERIRRAQENSSTPIDRSAFDAERDRAIAASNKLYDQADAKQSDPWFNMTESVRRYSEEASNTGAQIGNAMSNSFKTAEDAFVQFTTTGKISFKSMAASILSDLARIAAKKAIAGLVNMAINAWNGPSSGSSGSSSAGGFGYDYGPLAGARATGGSVLGNSAYLVGERGPEIFRPTGAGSITPNSSIGGAGSITINMELNVADSGTSTDSSGDSSQQARALGEMITSKVKEVISNERRQGGMLSNMQQGRG